jgi:hypothetical protein
LAEAKKLSAESATERGSSSKTAAIAAAMVTPDILSGTVMTTIETLPGTAMAITIKRALFEPVMMVAAVFSDCTAEVIARIKVWSMETMTR